MTDLILRTQAILKSHDATENRAPFRRSSETATDYLRVVGRGLTDVELLELREKCVRVEAARHGMKRDEIDRHWRATIGIERLTDNVPEGGLTTDVPKATPPMRYAAAHLESKRVDKLAKRFGKLSPRDIQQAIRRGELKETHHLLTERKPTQNHLRFGLNNLATYDVRGTRWKHLVRGCYDRLSPVDRKCVRSDLIAFYWRLRDYRSLEPFLPERPRQWTDVPKEMETYLRLNHLSKAKSLVAFCESKFDLEKRFRYELPLRLALSRYYAHIGNYDAALKQHSQMDTGNLWDYADYRSLISIKTNEALLIATRAYQKISQSAKKLSADRDAVVVRQQRHLKRTISQLRALNMRFDANI
jgi:hypothetical protein